MLISVVDDDPVFQFLCRTYLKNCSSDVELLFFNNGADAMKHFQEMPETLDRVPKLMLIDINMPLMDGWELVDNMERMTIFNESHVYMVSSSIASDDREQSLSKSLVKDYLKKPISPSVFDSIFKDAFGN
ncbi:response regulator [Sphingobacterium paludis]|uniref:Response regulator receiver domain-containing protein n=1 Tax=Sphingobacterium paludis TaxID=1476465 RepID=A0A4R7D8R4_9SPHI|nr:response regulator [Sphingobacterium paludis]TDS17663.1 response regulator receiver domain-containing protein [Sphingobacterium paludis]